MIITTISGLKYTYVTRTNRWIFASSEAIEGLINKFIAQDTTYSYMFQITYVETLINCDALIMVYKQNKDGDKLLYCDSVYASQNPVLDALCPKEECEDKPVSDIPVEELNYFDQNYIEEEYIEP